MKRFFAASLILSAVALALLGCGKDSNPANSNPPPQTGDAVTIQGFAFSPSNLIVSAGDTVTWTNNDATSHTSTSNTGAWDSGLIAQGNTFSRVFAAAGTFHYHCTPHPNMTGTITVQ